MEALKTISAALTEGRLTCTWLADGSAVLFDVQGIRMFSLNPVGAAILSCAADGDTDMESIRSRIEARFQVQGANVLSEIRAFVTDFEQAISPSPEASRANIGQHIPGSARQA